MIARDQALSTVERCPRLSKAERKVIELMAQGLANVGIANRLVLCERTVEAPVRVTSSAS